MNLLLSNLKIGLRLLFRHPGLSAGRALTVTLVVAAVTSVFTVANATILQPLPFPESDRLVNVYSQPPGTTSFDDGVPLHPLTVLRFRERAQSFEQFEAIWRTERALGGSSEPESVPSGQLTSGIFKMLGGRAELGRLFTEDEVQNAANVVVISHGLWSRRYGKNPSVIGQNLLLDGQSYAILGVMEKGFEPAFTDTEIWTPIRLKDNERLGFAVVQGFGRLRHGVSETQAGGELRRILNDARGEAPGLLKGWDVKVMDWREAQFGSRRPALLMLIVAVGALALIATANLTNLTLADVMHRRNDFAVRAALGGSRFRIAAPEAAEGVLLAAFGGTAGLAVSAALVPWILSLDKFGGLSPQYVSTNWRVAACGFLSALVVILLATIIPVLRLAGAAGLAKSVSAGTQRAIGSSFAHRVRMMLVTGQTALALVILATGATVASSFARTTRTDPGFDPTNVITAQLRLPDTVFPTHDHRVAFVQKVAERLKSTGGVVDAGFTLNPFAAPGLTLTTAVQIEDRPNADGQPYFMQFRRVTGGYFSTLKIPIRDGRAFDDRDVIGGQPVAMVSKAFADRFWPNENPVGKHVKRGSAPVWLTVVGVAADVRDMSLGLDPVPTLYVPYFQNSTSTSPVALVVRTASDPTATLGAIKRAIWEIDSNQPLANVVTADAFLFNSIGQQRFRSVLIAVCGILGLLLATIGTYGVTARSISERTKEVGIRLALGGRPITVRWALASRSMAAIGIGATVGFVISLLAGAGLDALLPDLHVAIAPFSAAAGAALILIGLLAAMMASRSVTAVEPVRALRNN